MDINTAKQLVIDAGLNLVKCGLIARTWGNVSCRIDENSFVITPSGIAYENLTPEKIVLVNIADCSYEGDVKPSSEKKVHASVYAMRPDANFVIHTHQTYASAVGAVGCDINYMTDEGAEIIGPGVTVAAYGLPGTKRLNNGVRAALERCPSKAIILSHHGAVCFGADYDAIQTKFADSVAQQTDKALDGIATHIAEPVSYALSYALCFIIIFVLVLVALWLIKHLLKLTEKLPVIKQANKVLGLVVGGVLGIIIVWVLSIMIKLGLPYLNVVAPTVFTEDLFEKSIILKLTYYLNAVRAMIDFSYIKKLIGV